MTIHNRAVVYTSHDTGTVRSDAQRVDRRESLGLVVQSSFLLQSLPEIIVRYALNSLNSFCSESLINRCRH